MKAELTFDCLYGDDEDNMEGCYRLVGHDWQVYYFTRWWDQGEPEIRRDAVWRSGVTGVNVRHPKDQPLNEAVVMAILSETLGIEAWSVVSGPDSLTLK